MLGPVISGENVRKAGYREVGIQRHHMYREGRWHDSWLGEVLRDEWLQEQQVQDEAAS